MKYVKYLTAVVFFNIMFILHIQSCEFDLDESYEFDLYEQTVEIFERYKPQPQPVRTFTDINEKFPQGIYVGNMGGQMGELTFKPSGISGHLCLLFHPLTETQTSFKKIPFECFDPSRDYVRDNTKRKIDGRNYEFAYNKDLGEITIIDITEKKTFETFTQELEEAYYSDDDKDYDDSLYPGEIGFKIGKLYALANFLQLNRQFQGFDQIDITENVISSPKEAEEILTIWKETRQFATNFLGLAQNRHVQEFLEKTE